MWEKLVEDSVGYLNEEWCISEETNNEKVRPLCINYYTGGEK